MIDLQAVKKNASPKGCDLPDFWGIWWWLWPTRLFLLLCLPAVVLWGLREAPRQSYSHSRRLDSQLRPPCLPASISLLLTLLHWLSRHSHLCPPAKHFQRGLCCGCSRILAKTIIVVLAFRVTAPGRRARDRLVWGAPNLSFPSIGSLTQLTHWETWVGTSAPSLTQTCAPSLDAPSSYAAPSAETCSFMDWGASRLPARNLPDTFSEAKLVTFSMLVSCTVWSPFSPSTTAQGQQHRGRGDLHFGLQCCIFAPSASLPQ